MVQPTTEMIQPYLEKSKNFSHFQNALFLFHLHDFPLVAIMMNPSLMKYFCGKAEHFN